MEWSREAERNFCAFTTNANAKNPLLAPDELTVAKNKFQIQNKCLICLIKIIHRELLAPLGAARLFLFASGRSFWYIVLTNGNVER